MTETNRHVVDRFTETRQEVNRLERELAKLRAEILQKPPTELIGDEYMAVVGEQTRRTVDRDKLEREMGRAFVEKYLKVSTLAVISTRPRLATSAGAPRAYSRGRPIAHPAGKHVSR